MNTVRSHQSALQKRAFSRTWPCRCWSWTSSTQNCEKTIPVVAPSSLWYLLLQQPKTDWETGLMYKTLPYFYIQIMDNQKYRFIKWKISFTVIVRWILWHIHKRMKDISEKIYRVKDLKFTTFGISILPQMIYKYPMESPTISQKAFWVEMEKLTLKYIWKKQRT